MGGAAARDGDAPAGLLAHLNRVQLESGVGGFVTCLCADVSPDGIFTLANAGHLAPYRNGSEIARPPCLPLGIAGAVEYSETVFALNPGETATLLSDGVVEARNTGGELFGFEKTQTFSRQSAGEIEQAAQALGQEDDITILSLTRQTAVPNPSRATAEAVVPAVIRAQPHP